MIENILVHFSIFNNTNNKHSNDRDECNERREKTM